jgi:NAD(P)-dependent dehydrogenase (short-subunit alcohol dehydrogenase family)
MAERANTPTMTPMRDWMRRFSLDGKVALITGGTSGIGFEAARVLADAGADIVAAGTVGGQHEDVVGTVTALGRRAKVITGNLADASDTVRIAREALAAFGRIDIIVNNAGIARNAPLLDATIADWDYTMAVNLRAPFLIAQTLVPEMIARRAGKIINLSSQAGVVALNEHGAYCASKGGLNMLTKAMTIEWAQHNIQANAICPTVILTPLGQRVWGAPEKGGPMLAKIPLGRFGEPIEVADAILFLASSASDLINGETLMLDGGFTAA